VQTFLQILGLVLLAGILAVFGGLLLLGLKLRRAFREVKASLGQLSSSFGPQPATIHLEGPTSVEWAKGAEVRALADALPALGFHDAGQYSVEELPGLNVWPFVNPSESAYAVVYEHPAGPVWMDFVTRYEDGTSLTTTSTSEGADLDHRPGHEKDYGPGLSPAQLHQRHLSRRAAGPMAPASAGAFQGAFERAYAEEMAWRNGRGGPTEREIRAIAARQGRTMTDEEVEEARKVMAAQAMDGLDEALRERFTETADLPPREWERVRDSLVFVHDKLTAELLDERVRDWIDEDDDGGSLPTVPDGVPARVAFAKFNASLPRAKRFEKIGEVDRPVAADVYRAPG
jgi:hypothetical protein